MVSMKRLAELAGIRENERVIRVIHRHWFDLASHLFGVAALSVALFLGLFLFPILFPDAFSGEGARIAFFIESTFFLLLFVYAFLVWIDIWFDSWIITNERIVNMEQKGLFVRHVSQGSFSKVQDATSETEGIFQSVLNYGEVYVQSAGETPRFVFRNIPDPIGTKALIMRLAQDARADDLEDAAEILDDMQRSRGRA
jgi:hypothetical protein